MHAATLFGNLESFMRQALDQATATQALWHALSSRLRVSLRPQGGSGKGTLIRQGPGGCEVRVSSRPQALAECLLGQAVSRLWGKAVRTDSVLRRHPAITSPCHHPLWHALPLPGSAGEPPVP